MGSSKPRRTSHVQLFRAAFVSPVIGGGTSDTRTSTNAPVHFASFLRCTAPKNHPNHQTNFVSTWNQQGTVTWRCIYRRTKSMTPDGLPVTRQHPRGPAVTPWLTGWYLATPHESQPCRLAFLSSPLSLLAAVKSERVLLLPLWASAVASSTDQRSHLRSNATSQSYPKFVITLKLSDIMACWLQAFYKLLKIVWRFGFEQCY